MKYILVCEDSSHRMSEKVQEYLDQGYELKGDTFTTTVSMYRSVMYQYSQVLIKKEEKS